MLQLQHPCQFHELTPASHPKHSHSHGKQSHHTNALPAQKQSRQAPTYLNTKHFTNTVHRMNHTCGTIHCGLDDLLVCILLALDMNKRVQCRCKEPEIRIITRRQAFGYSPAFSFLSMIAFSSSIVSLRNFYRIVMINGRKIGRFYVSL